MTDRRMRRREPTAETPSAVKNREIMPSEPAALAPTLEDLEQENRELQAAFDAKRAEADKKAKAGKLARDNLLLKAQLNASAEFPDGTTIDAGQSLLYPDPTRLDERWRDPGREYYWGLPEQEGYLTQIGYVKEAAPQVKQPDGTLARHPQVVKGYQLWSTPREMYLYRKGQERALAGQRLAEAEDLAGVEGLHDAPTVGKEDLPSR